LLDVNLAGRYYLSVFDPLASEIQAAVFTDIVALNGTMQHNGTAAMCADRCNVHQDSFNP